MHRIELKLGMYHHLRALEARQAALGESLTEEHQKARIRIQENFKPQLLQPVSIGKPGHDLAHWVAAIIPAAQLFLWGAIKLSN